MADLSAARELMSSDDWDAEGATSVHVPTWIAVRFLRDAGWHVLPTGEWIAPDGQTYWMHDEALTIAITASTL